MTLAVGDPAPDFTSWSTRGGEKVGDAITFSDVYKGRRATVLAFFPLAFSRGCRNELAQFGMDVDEFKQLNAEVIGCSVDSVYVLDEFDRAARFGWNLVSDFNREIGALYGVLDAETGQGLKGVHRRSVFVVDRGGTIRYVWESDGRSLPNDEEILEAIRKL